MIEIERYRDRKSTESTHHTTQRRSRLPMLNKVWYSVLRDIAVGGGLQRK